MKAIVAGLAWMTASACASATRAPQASARPDLGMLIDAGELGDVKVRSQAHGLLVTNGPIAIPVAFPPAASACTELPEWGWAWRVEGANDVLVLDERAQLFSFDGSCWHEHVAAPWTVGHTLEEKGTTQALVSVALDRFDPSLAGKRAALGDVLEVAGLVRAPCAYELGERFGERLLKVTRLDAEGAFAGLRVHVEQHGCVGDIDYEQRGGRLAERSALVTFDRDVGDGEHEVARLFSAVHDGRLFGEGSKSETHGGPKASTRYRIDWVARDSDTSISLLPPLPSDDSVTLHAGDDQVTTNEVAGARVTLSSSDLTLAWPGQRPRLTLLSHVPEPGRIEVRARVSGDTHKLFVHAEGYFLTEGERPDGPADFGIDAMVIRSDGRVIVFDRVAP